MEAPDSPRGNKNGTAGNHPERNAARQRSPRQACIRLFTGAAFFVVLQIAAAVTLELWLPGAIDPDYGVRIHSLWQGRAADPERTATIVMLGSSRTYYALHGDAPHWHALDTPLSRESGRPTSVVNFGFTGAGPVTELLTWRRLQQDGVRPDLLLIEVLPAFLSSTFPVDETSENRMPTDRLRWRDLSTLKRYGAGRTRPQLRRGFMEAASVIFYSRRLEILNAFVPPLVYSAKPNEPLIERLAPGPFPAGLTRQDRDKARAFARTEYIRYLRDFHIGGRGCDALHELLASCRQAGVPAALVLMPEGPEFRSWYPPETWRQIQTWVEQIGRAEGASLVNARQWIGEDDFLDSHHLLPRGADEFSERLGREYILPLLRRLPDDGKPPHRLAVRPP